jgi:hypothetical protein
VTLIVQLLGVLGAVALIAALMLEKVIAGVGLLFALVWPAGPRPIRSTDT